MTMNPMKLNTAAIVTAWIGVSTFVATIVAMEFAESWNPFTKSNAHVRKMAAIAMSGRARKSIRESVSHSVYQGNPLVFAIGLLSLLAMSSELVCPNRIRRFAVPIGVYINYIESAY
jgi:hypothetical protein